MNKQTLTINKPDRLKPAEDFFALRREGIGFIEQAGSLLWTDYNIHDPGITILESLCYVLTDIAYRSGWPIADILTLENSNVGNPYPDQAFFSAREILTTGPVTPDDFRRVLIDLEPVRNAWVFCKTCGCDADYYAACDNDRLVLSYRNQDDDGRKPERVEVLGLYEVLLELEDDPELGDLNDRKIKKTLQFYDAEGRAHSLLIELRFPSWHLSGDGPWQVFLEHQGTFSTKVRFGATKDYDVLTDPLLDQAGRDSYLKRHWREVFYVDFEVVPEPGGETIAIENVAMRLIGDSVAKDQTSVDLLNETLSDASGGELIGLYHRKVQKTKDAVVQAKEKLQRVRNLDEDYCRIDVVELSDIAVCADVEVASDADIDRVQARIWFEIERYLNPPVPFYSLRELMAAAYPTESIFNGPVLTNGFIKSEDLERSRLQSELRTSDLINRLMDIDGVKAVNNLLLTLYDGEGRVVKGKADPVWQDNGLPLFDPNKVSAAWQLMIDDRTQPRFYRELSRFLFFKNGLPFLARADEALDTLLQLKGEAERPKLKDTANDLPLPKGSYRNPGEYFPLQYGFPLTYGIGPEGLPSHASQSRRAQAKQLKAYLLVFEQFLSNQFAQLAHTADLFSLNPEIRRTYFVRELTQEIIDGYDSLVEGLDLSTLKTMTEPSSEFLERRNRFLDHLLARFGEHFSEYALLLTDIAGRSKARELLIDTKLSFLTALPLIGRERYRAFDYRVEPCSADNHPVLKKRVGLLLGQPDLRFAFGFAEPSGGMVEIAFELTDFRGRLWLSGAFELDQNDAGETASYRSLMTRISDASLYETEQVNDAVRLTLKDAAIGLVAEHPHGFETKEAADAFKNALLSWSANERAILVEHLLLRPKFPGDALYPVCAGGACMTCGDEDPYSFRLTWVMPGWTYPFNHHMELRGFAERTIRRETPSHLLVKICWVGNDGFAENPCDPAISDLAELLIAKGFTETGERLDESAACDCARSIYSEFAGVFSAWYRVNAFDYFDAEALQTLLPIEFAVNVDLEAIECGVILDVALSDEIISLLADHFSGIVRYGRQFERFEQAWCRWLDANAAIDWTEERLQQRLEALLREGLVEGGSSAGDSSKLCRCAAAILAEYGSAFYDWLEGNIESGHALDELTPFTAEPVTLCADFDFEAGTDAKIRQWLDDRYGTYVEVSYRLRVVVKLMADLKNIYPEATLHDCDDGSDDNPVRLDKTALGSLNAVQRPFDNSD